MPLYSANMAFSPPPKWRFSNKMAEFTGIMCAFSCITFLSPPPPATLTVHMYAEMQNYFRTTRLLCYILLHKL